MRELLLKFANKEITAIKAIRTLSAIIDPVHAINVLAVINAITRVEQGDLDIETFKVLVGLESNK